MTSLASAFNTLSFQGQRNARFHLPKAEEIQAINRMQAFEKFADELDSMSMRDEIIPMNNLRVAFDPTGKATLGLFRDGKLIDQMGIDLESRFLSQTASETGVKADITGWLTAGRDEPRWLELAQAALNLSLEMPLKDVEPDRKRMVRVINGMASANMSNGYLRVDNGPMKDWVMNLARTTSLVPIHWSMRQGDMTMKLLLPVARNVARPSSGLTDDIFFGMEIYNSITGGSSLGVQSFNFRRVCDNGMMRVINGGEAVVRRHIGRRKHTVGTIGYNREEAEAVDTILERAALSARRMVSDDIIDAEIIEIHRAQDAEASRDLTRLMIEARPSIGAFATAIGTTQRTAEAVLTELYANPTGGIEPGEHPTVWGLANAITATARDQKVDAAQELMALGGSITSWNAKKLNATLDAMAAALS